jgi:DNA replication and repair protein RecF
MRLRNFRNLGVQELVFPPEGVALIGDNAQGKTNLLEAIYYLETFRSFRGSPDTQMVAFESDVFRLVGEISREGADHTTEVAVGYARAQRRKKVSVDGAEASRLADALGQLGAVVFSPADVEIVSGSPSERRRFLDVALSLNSPGYVTALLNYRHALAQRNAALKQGAPGGAVDAWEHALIDSGATVMWSRQEWISCWAGRFSALYRAVGGGEEAQMKYRPSAHGRAGGEEGGAHGEEQISEVLRLALEGSRERDERMGNTGVGPHRDDFVMRLTGRDDELDLRDYGSGGQRRTAAFSLRMIEAETVRSARGEDPVILLDDVFAELDEGRSERILEVFEGERASQVILTAPKAGDVKLGQDRLPRWHVSNGIIRA